MPRHESVIVTSSWVELTAGDVTEITLQPLGGHGVDLQFTVGSVAPVAVDGLRVGRHEAVIARPLSELAPGVAGANRVWAKAPSRCAVFVSHA